MRRQNLPPAVIEPESLKALRSVQKPKRPFPVHVKCPPLIAMAGAAAVGGQGGNVIFNKT